MYQKQEIRYNGLLQSPWQGMHTSALPRDGFEVLQNGAYQTIHVVGSQETLRTFGDDILNLQERVFHELYEKQSPILRYEHKERDQASIREHLLDNQTLVVLLQEKTTGNLVGFTYAYPAPPDTRALLSVGRRAELASMQLTPEEYLALQKNHAEVGWTAIQTDHQHKGGWTLMMKELERRIKATGKYTHMLRFVRTANHYADKVKQRYADKIVFDHTFTSHFFGDQRYYRITL